MAQNMQQIGVAMMEAARHYPNDMIANAMARVGDGIFRQGQEYVKRMSKTDQMVVDFYLTLPTS